MSFSNDRQHRRSNLFLGNFHHVEQVAAHSHALGQCVGLHPNINKTFFRYLENSLFAVNLIIFICALTCNDKSGSLAAGRFVIFNLITNFLIDSNPRKFVDQKMTRQVFLTKDTQETGKCLFLVTNRSQKVFQLKVVLFSQLFKVDTLKSDIGCFFLKQLLEVKVYFSLNETVWIPTHIDNRCPFVRATFKDFRG